MLPETQSQTRQPRCSRNRKNSHGAWEEKAEQTLRIGTRLSPQDKQTFYWLGQSRMAQEHFSQTSEAFARSTLFDPDATSTYSDLGLALMAQETTEDAKNALKQAIRIQPE